MLKIQSPSAKPLCDAVSRRRFIEIGSLSAFGLSLAGLLKSEAKAAEKPSAAAPLPLRKTSPRSVILIWQHGGPSQLETFDMKPRAVAEVRGPFQSIASRLPGLDVCELCPEQAKIMDKCTVIRSFSHDNSDHWAAAHWMLTGYLGATSKDPSPRQPSLCAISSLLLGSRKPGVLPAVNMNDGGFGFHSAAWLGVSNNPFRYGDYSYGNEGAPIVAGDHSSFSLAAGLTKDRLMDRVSLQQQLDVLRKRHDTNSTFMNLDAIDRQALDIVLSGRAREAFRLENEDPKVRDRYGPGWGEQALLARRLIEAGVRFVTLNTGYWDDHGSIKPALTEKMPRHDRAVGMLIQDLADRGMLEDTLVVSAGEFGRTPKINDLAGRDHWPKTQSVLIAGGGYRHGQVIGATDAHAAFPVDRPIGVEDFCAIIYRALGLSNEDTIVGPSGRPMHLLPGGQVPREMV